MKILAIIGNGFDLGHDLPTRFDDFIHSNYNIFKTKYGVFSDGDNCWNEIEDKYAELLCEIIGEREDFDVIEEVDNIIQDYGFTEYGEVNYFCYTSDAFNDENKKIAFYIDLLNQFENDFQKYLCSFRTDDCVPYSMIKDILLSSNKIINFNYTKTLEEVYGIEDIVHIHGSIDDTIAIGCGSLEEAKTTAIDDRYPTIEMFSKDKHGLQEIMVYYEYDDDGNRFENHFIKSFFDEVSAKVSENEEETYKLIDAKSKSTLELRKKVIQDLRKEHYDLVYIIGHSLGDADKEVFDSINKDAKFIYFYHGNIESNRNFDIKKRIGELNWECEWISNKQVYH